MTHGIPPTLSDLAVKLDALKPYGRNPRRGNVEVIAESLAAHGQYRPIVVRKGSNEVLAGNHTLAAARHLGWTEVAATFVDVSDDEAARIVLVDNKAADMGSYDDRELLVLLKELDALDSGLTGTGYSADELDDLAALLSESEDATAVGPVADDADAERDNAWETTSLKQYAERYEEQGRRLVVLDYDRNDYTRVIAGLDQLRARYEVDNNSHAVALHLASLFPDATTAAAPEGEVAQVGA